MSPVVNPGVAFVNLVDGAQECCSSQGNDDGQRGSPLCHPGGETADGNHLSLLQPPQPITSSNLDSGTALALALSALGSGLARHLLGPGDLATAKEDWRPMHKHNRVFSSVTQIQSSKMITKSQRYDSVRLLV